MTVAGGASIDHAAARDALARAREVLWRTQRSDGSWESLCDMGVIPTAQVLVALHGAGSLAPADAADGARWLRARQGADGSYRSHPTATEGDLGRDGFGLGRAPRLRGGREREAIARARAYLDALRRDDRGRSTRSGAATRRSCTWRWPD